MCNFQILHRNLDGCLISACDRSSSCSCNRYLIRCDIRCRIFWIYIYCNGICIIYGCIFYFYLYGKTVCIPYRDKFCLYRTLIDRIGFSCNIAILRLCNGNLLNRRLKFRCIHISPISRLCFIVSVKKQRALCRAACSATDIRLGMQP